MATITVYSRLTAATDSVTSHQGTTPWVVTSQESFLPAYDQITFIPSSESPSSIQYRKLGVLVATVNIVYDSYGNIQTIQKV